jgi:cold shock protein
MVNNSPSGKRQGRVKWFNDTKGYGFIVVDNTPDIFVHYSAIKMEGFRTLKEGDIVEFELLHSTKGLQAINVTKVDSSEEQVDQDEQNGNGPSSPLSFNNGSEDYELEMRKQSAG